MRIKLLLSLLVTVMCVCFVNAADAEEMNASIETSFMSKYMWHGFELYDNKTATSIDFKVELGESGLYFGTEYITPNGSGNVNVSDFDNYGYLKGSLTDRAKYIYYVGYMTSMFDTDVFRTDIDFKYQYHDYYKISSDVLDQQEFSLLAQWKDIVGYGFVPYYQATYLSDAEGGRSVYSASVPPMPFNPPIYGEDQNANIGGWLHTVGLSLDVPLDFPEIGMTKIKLLVESVYNDGAFDTSNAAFDANRSMGCGSEWTHVTYGAQTNLDMGLMGLGFGVYYQQALADDYSNLNNTFYSTVSCKLEF